MAAPSNTPPVSGLNLTPNTKKRNTLHVLRTVRTPKKITVHMDPQSMLGSCLTCCKPKQGHTRPVASKEMNYRELLRTVLLIDVPLQTKLQICDTCVRRLLEVSAWRQLIEAKLTVEGVNQPPSSDAETLGTPLGKENNVHDPCLSSTSSMLTSNKRPLVSAENSFSSSTPTTTSYTNARKKIGIRRQLLPSPVPIIQSDNLSSTYNTQSIMCDTPSGSSQSATHSDVSSMSTCSSRFFTPDTQLPPPVSRDSSTFASDDVYLSSTNKGDQSSLYGTLTTPLSMFGTPNMQQSLPGTPITEQSHGPSSKLPTSGGVSAGSSHLSDHGYSITESIPEEGTAESLQPSNCSKSISQDQQAQPGNLSEPMSKSIPKLVKDTNVFAVVDSTQRQLLFSINSQLDLLATKTNTTVLKSQEWQDLTDPDILHRIVKELMENAPFLYLVLYMLCAPLHRTPNNTEATIAMIYSMGMYNRNKKLSLLQRINTAVAIRCNATNEILDVFQKLGLTLQSKAKYKYLDRMGDHNTDKMVIAVRRGLHGKVTVDNIDGHIVSNQIRLGDERKDFHYTHATYYVARAQLDHLSIEPPPFDGINPAIYYLSMLETDKLKKSYGRHIGMVMAKRFKAFKWMNLAYEKFPEHTYSEAMDQKSEFFSLEVMMEDPKAYKGCINVLKKLSAILQKVYATAGRADDLGWIYIPLGGDQLVRVRFDGALALCDGARTFRERFECFKPVIIEFFHVGQDFLEKLYRRFFKDGQTRNACTLPYLKTHLKRKNINGNVKAGRYECHSEFLLMVWEAMLIELILQTFGMDSVDDDAPAYLGIPRGVYSLHRPARIALAKQVTDRIVDRIFHPVVNPEEQAAAPAAPAPDQPPQPFVNGAGPILPPADDDVRNYCAQLLEWGMHYKEFWDAMKNGDIERHTINVKRLIPFFYTELKSSRYAMELINYLTKTEVLLPEQIAVRIKLGNFVNPKGGRGKNKPADMQQENNIKIVKTVIRNLGANKTDEAMTRASKAAPVLKDIATTFSENLGVKGSSGEHTKRDDTADIMSTCAYLRAHRPFDSRPGRELASFKLSANPFTNINDEHFMDFILDHAEAAVEDM